MMWAFCSAAIHLNIHIFIAQGESNHNELCEEGSNTRDPEMLSVQSLSGLRALKEGLASSGCIWNCRYLSFMPRVLGFVLHFAGFGVWVSLLDVPQPTVSVSWIQTFKMPIDSP